MSSRKSNVLAKLLSFPRTRRIHCVAKILKYSNIPAILALTENQKSSLSIAKQGFGMTSSKCLIDWAFWVKIGLLW